jgi:hypothetical protein
MSVGMLGSPECYLMHDAGHAPTASQLPAVPPCLPATAPAGTPQGEKASVQVAALLGERSSYALAVSGLVLGEGAPGRGSGDARLEQLYTWTPWVGGIHAGPCLGLLSLFSIGSNRPQHQQS